ncbi:MAG: diaminobutyrate--2-oxoglutarate transaminase [Candidatus Hydrogenedentes bacterium]|nr:diaminobutyrate--2-oxoglutarate transaminase [Candidatus Hydrogenedentota bacterium]
METFNRLESEVRGYCRSFPTIFTKARGPYLYDEGGNEFIDFLSGAGSLNYGHNNPIFKKRLIAYLAGDGLVHGLDMHSEAKHRFLAALEKFILKPREFEYKVQFTGPTGTNAVEAAFKLARKVTGRRNIISFTNGYHGLTMGALATTGNSHYRDSAGVAMPGATFMPFDGYLGREVNTLDYLDKMLGDGSSGVDLPAAIVVETIQGEGGVNVASHKWLRGLEHLCRKHDILLIVDDIQVGCGRTGTFFSFEEAGITPDMVTLSKSLSGYGLPMAVVLIRPELDQWQPGEHTGTFRGNNAAFVTAAEALEVYWRDNGFTKRIKTKGELLRGRLEILVEKYPALKEVSGRGMIQGLECDPPQVAGQITKAAFGLGLVIETSGAKSQVIKFLPPLAIDTGVLEEGLNRFEQEVAQIFEKSRTNGNGKSKKVMELQA